MAVNRGYPVTLYVPDPLTAEIAMGGMILPLSAEDNTKLMHDAREVIASHAEKMGGASLPVTIMDNSEEEPFLVFRLCTREGKMPIDDEVSAGTKKSAQERFLRWQKDLRRASHRLVPVAVASDRETEEPVPPVQAFTPAVMTTDRVVEKPSDLDEGRQTLSRSTSKPTDHSHAWDVEPESDLTPESEPEPVELPERFDMPTLMRYGADEEIAEQRLRGALNRMGLHLAPDADEKAWRAAVETMNEPWKGMKKVAVVNERGGAGKTITSANLAAAFAHATALPVAGFDNNETGGNWHKRTGLNHGHKLTSLDTALFYREHEGITRDELDAHSHRHPKDHYSLFAAHRSFKRHNPQTGRIETVKVEERDVSDFYRAVNGHYRLTITDSGNALGAPNWERMVDECDQLVVPVMTDPARDDGALEAFRLLDSYGGHFAELAANAVVVVSVWRRGDVAEAKAAVKRWTPRVREVVVVPHDNRLSGALSFTKLHFKTQLAWMRVGAAVAKGFQD